MKKYLSAIALALVLTLSFTACSKDEDKKSDSKGKNDTETTMKKSASPKGNLLAKSAAKTQEQDSVELKGTFTFSGDASGVALDGDYLIEGLQSFKTGDSVMKIDMTALLGALGGGAVESDQTFIIETRTTGGYTYTKTPSIFGSAETWSKTKAASANATQDPSQFLEYFKGATDDFETIGTEDIDGVSTTQYKATLSADKYKEQIKAASEDITDVEINAITSVFSSPIVANLWVDEDGLIRKFEMTISIDGNSLLGSTGTDTGSSSGTLTMKAVIFYSNYGVDVNVELPPADQITE